MDERRRDLARVRPAARLMRVRAAEARRRAAEYRRRAEVASDLWTQTELRIQAAALSLAAARDELAAALTNR